MLFPPPRRPPQLLRMALHHRHQHRHHRHCQGHLQHGFSLALRRRVRARVTKRVRGIRRPIIISLGRRENSALSHLPFRMVVLMFWVHSLGRRRISYPILHLLPIRPSADSYLPLVWQHQQRQRPSLQATHQRGTLPLSILHVGLRVSRPLRLLPMRLGLRIPTTTILSGVHIQRVR
jgi:hypothetical protein